MERIYFFVLIIVVLVFMLLIVGLLFGWDKVVVVEIIVKFQVDICWIKNLLLFFYILDGYYVGYGICDILVDKINVRLLLFDSIIDVFLQLRIN